MNTREWVEWMATLCTVALWLTGILTCNKILKQGNTSNVSFVPFMVMFCSCTLWVKYGLIKDDKFVTQVNLIGAILNFLFGAVYYGYTTHRLLLHRQLVAGVLLIYPVLLYIRYYATDRGTAIHTMGIACATLSVLAYSSPLASLADVLVRKSVESMSFPLCAFNLIVAIEWFYYGLIMGDLFIKVPNGLGTFLGALQILIYIRYGWFSTRVVTRDVA